MISKKMTEALNNQITAELYSSYLYMAMSSYSSFIGLKGAASWYHVQAQEEMTHALRLYNYVNSVGEHAVLGAIDKPQAEYKSLMHMFEETLKHEKKVTSMINDLVNLAAEENDHATEIFLQWFVNEQVEEEENVNEVLSRLKLAGEDGGGLFMVDNELAARVFTFPPDLVKE
ncbi:ferritin [Verrucomicrobiota bacterium]